MIPKLRVLLAEDHAVVRAGLRALINAEPGLEVVCDACNGREALAAIVRLQPDVAVLDLTMPEMNGVEVARALSRLNGKTKVLALTMHEDRGYVRQMLESGASGYVLKRAAPDELIRAIHAVAAGGTYLDSHVASTVVSDLRAPAHLRAAIDGDLSARETEVIQLIAQGFTNKEVGAQLGVSTKTVESYKVRSMEKLGLQGRVDLVQFAVARGWLRGPASRSPTPDAAEVSSEA